MRLFASCRSFSVPRQLRMGFVLMATLLILVMNVTPIFAQENSPQGNQIDGFSVVLDDQVLFKIRQGIPDLASASERAQVINDRLLNIANDASIEPESIQVEEQDNLSIIQAGETVLFTVRDVDTEADKSRQETAEEIVTSLRSALTQYREERSAQQLTRGVILAIISTLLFGLFIFLLQQAVSKIMMMIRAARRSDQLNLRFNTHQILDSDAVSYLFMNLVKFIRLALIFVSLYIYIPFILSQFPGTKSLGNSMLNDVTQQTSKIVKALAEYLPNLAVIAVIMFLTYYIIGFVHLVITELGHNENYSGFYSEWIQPTRRLSTFLIVAIACVVAGPYLPGAGSPAFQGVSLFLGALLTLGSSSAVANAVSGTIVIYTRAFQIGDFIRIGDLVGEVSEKSLFVTRILTPKQEVITIPNSSVLNSSVINYSAITRESKSCLVLHTTITLGYDVPWRKVHEVLIRAAQSTAHILAEPHPFVLQTSLNDFNVSYQLNAYSHQPKLMAIIYSELHQNIQDYCNEAGIEILSPGFSAIRDGNHSTIPSHYLPEGYTPPTFQIKNPTSKS